jgi:hypothetical protein
MGNNDVKVREIRLLESYSQAYNRFMDATIHMTFRFRTLFAQKDDQARDLEHKIKDHLNIAQQKLAHAKSSYEASAKRGGGMGGMELAHRERALEKYKALYKKAQNYAESAKKLYQNIHGEFERVEWMTNRQRHKLEDSRDEGNNFLKKAIDALNEYKQ